ncbi:MAG TPA: hypothetical protein VMV72_06520 [Verrucomicrobiae bacterium]|nr:hypothetical protein [Verrucomicrobiae bacterium]
MKEGKCPICGLLSQVDYDLPAWRVVCLRCGTYSIAEITSILLERSQLTPAQVANACGWVREHPDVQVNDNHLPTFKSLKDPTVGDKGTKLLIALSKLHPTPGTTIKMWSGSLTSTDRNSGSLSMVPPADRSVLLEQYLYLAGSAWIEGKEVFDYLMWDYLRDARGLIGDGSVSPDRLSGLEKASGFRVCKITPAGWAFIDDLQRANAASHVGFIAMWFQKDLDPVHLAIDSGIRAAGYDAERIDRVEHNNRIDDEIIAWIRRSKFVVADFTGNRGGVYFESGYALGMGLQVIWLCREDELPNIHFDNRQYNFIVWSPDRLPELTQRLQNRIEATIGRPA